jgi:hypothetical protein
MRILERDSHGSRCRLSAGAVSREEGPAKRLGNGVGWRHGHPHDRDRRSRHRSRHRRDPVRSLITLALARFRGVGFIEAGPAANNPGPRAVLRQPAPSAPRQRTLEANGVDCGASVLRSGLRRERYGSRSGERTGELGEDRQVGMEPEPFRATNAKPCQRPVMRARRALPLRCGDCALKLGLVAEGGERSMPTERHRCGVATRLLALQARRGSVCPRAGEISSRAAEA